MLLLDSGLCSLLIVGVFITILDASHNTTTPLLKMKLSSVESSQISESCRASSGVAQNDEILPFHVLFW